MALGILAIMFLSMILLAVIGSVFLFFIKNKKISDISLVLMVFYALVIASISFSSQPSNFILERIIPWIIGATSVLGLILRVLKKEQSLYSKIIVVISVFGGITYMILG